MSDYRTLFDRPIEEIQEDMLFRADNFQAEPWYGDLQLYLRIGVCQPDRKNIPNLQKALKVLGYPTAIKEKDGKPYLVPQRNAPEQTRSRPKPGQER